MDKLFDISSCCSKWSVIRCDDLTVKYNKENYQTRQISYICSLYKKVISILCLLFFICLIGTNSCSDFQNLNLLKNINLHPVILFQ